MLAAAAAGAEPFLKLGREQTEATFKIQKDVLEAYEEASRAWLARVASRAAGIQRTPGSAATHATANAGHGPRITLQLTGVVTERTRDFLRTLRSRSPYSV